MMIPVGELQGHERRSDREQGLRHDLRQATSAMSAMLCVIEADPLRTATVMARLEQLRLQADWMLLVLAEMHADRVRPRPVDVGDAVAHAWSVVGLNAMATVRLHRERVPYAVVDPVALRRSVRNLLDNAVRAAGPRGFVEISVRHEGGNIVIEVADSGPGFGRIPAQQGLGLVTTRRFLRNAGGSLKVGTSELGGALVRMRIPALVERPATEVSPA